MDAEREESLVQSTESVRRSPSPSEDAALNGGDDFDFDDDDGDSDENSYDSDSEYDYKLQEEDGDAGISDEDLDDLDDSLYGMY
jgi:hypothetical protein